MKNKETFDSAYEKLEEIVNQIQSWQIPLEQLVNKIKEAKKLISYCEWVIKDIDKQVNEILPEKEQKDVVD
jgi:exodeoxyribonuclease VII small subunit